MHPGVLVPAAAVLLAVALPARDVIHLREWEGFSFEEIGERLGLQGNTARMRFERALPKLARKIVALRSGHLARELG